MRSVLIAAAFLVLAADAACAQSVVVVKPAAGQTVLKEEICQIRWTKSGTMPGLVRISLRNAQTLAEVLLVKDDKNNSGSHDWLVPKEVPDGSHVIRVRVKGTEIRDDSAPFTIVGAPPAPAIVKVPNLRERVPPVALVGRPALSVSGADLVPYEDSFRITFAYRNSGTGNLPKASEMPVKPTFRVVLDGAVLNQGTLTIPAFPAPPGWEMPSFYGGEIKLPASWDYPWTIGSTLVVSINDNGAGGMPADSRSFDMKQLALKRVFDALVEGAEYDWATGVMTVAVRVDGELGGAGKLRLFSSGSAEEFVDTSFGGFMEEHTLTAGKHSYRFSRKIDLPYAGSRYEFKSQIGALVLAPGSAYPDRRDINHTNNRRLSTFRR